jgi:hypothetical protein
MRDEQPNPKGVTRLKLVSSMVFLKIAAPSTIVG